MKVLEPALLFALSVPAAVGSVVVGRHDSVAPDCIW